MRWQSIAATWTKFTEEWQKQIIAGAVGITLLLVGYFARSALHLAEIAWSDFRNVTVAQAAQIAKMYVGERVGTAKPFRNVGDNRQYVAVSSKKEAPFDVFLLVGNGREYEIDKLGELPTFDFGLLDLGHKGKTQVFTVGRDGGSGGQEIEIHVYDTGQETDYSLTVSEDSVDAPALSYSENVDKNSAVRLWLQTKAEELTFKSLAAERSTREIDLWRKVQGSDFTYGQIDVHEFPGTIPNPASVACKVDDGWFEWVSYFKGPVYGYDKRENRHFIVYIPQDEYNWITTLTSGAEYVWFGEGKDTSSLVFSKKTHSLDDPKRMGEIADAEFASAKTCSHRE